MFTPSVFNPFFKKKIKSAIALLLSRDHGVVQKSVGGLEYSGSHTRAVGLLSSEKNN